MAIDRNQKLFLNAKLGIHFEPKAPLDRKDSSVASVGARRFVPSNGVIYLDGALLD